ncbi:unnamed protein product [Moneuplotes crassus]|uniref:Uncharacterized protein n=1 Tax=Euplotes crassus TaxID=5936 RepID=A0AAD1X5H3_EUPCR|nr:unnamed protein product [Moneuplotes crassus]
MPLKPKEVEADFIKEQNKLRIDPARLIEELEDLLTNWNSYYSKRRIILEALDGKNLDNAIYEAITYLQGVDPVHELQHSKHLEKAAKMYFTIENPESRLSERVENFCTWDGEINEIVHYTRKGVDGKDILICILLSDEDNVNKDIIFSPDFEHFGMKIGINNKGEYCVILTYASYLEEENSINNPEVESIDPPNEYFEDSDKNSEPEPIGFEVEARQKPSRRTIEFDETEGSVKRKNTKNDTSLGESSEENENSNVEQQFSMAKNVSRRNNNLIDCNPPGGAIHNSPDFGNEGKSTNDGESRSHTAGNHIMNDRYTASYEFRTPEKYGSASRKSIGSKKKSKITKSIDRRYGRAGTVVEKEIDKNYEDDKKTELIPSRFISRGGFSAKKSKYINDGEYFDDEELEAVAYGDKFRTKKTYTTTGADYLIEPEYPRLKYVRKSGFGKTANMRDYTANLNYNRPIASSGRYYQEYEAIGNSPKPSQEITKHYKRQSTVFANSLKSPEVKNKNASKSPFNKPKNCNFQNRRRSTMTSRVTYLDRTAITGEEYDLFNKF